MLNQKLVSGEGGSRTFNTTIGLPFVRTSPGHGTAFDIAKLGIADARSMVEAIKLTAKLVESRSRTDYIN